MATIPVYPNAVEESLTAPLYWPVTSTPSDICSGTDCPTIQGAHRYFSTESYAPNVHAWYRERMAEAGYLSKGGSSGRTPYGEFESARFFKTDKPDTTVQVSTLISSISSRRLPLTIAISVERDIFRPRPTDSYLPSNINSIGIDYVSWDGVRRSAEVTDRETADDMARIFNRMPPRPTDQTYFCRPGAGILELGTTTTEIRDQHPTIRLQLRTSQGSQEVRIIHGCPFRVEFGAHPDLQDTRNLLWEAVEVALGVRVKENISISAPPAYPTPPPAPIPTVNPMSMLTPEWNMAAYYAWPDKYKFMVGEDLAVRFAYPESPELWAGFAFVTHVPSGSGLTLRRTFGSPEPERDIPQEPPFIERSSGNLIILGVDVSVMRHYTTRGGKARLDALLEDEESMRQILHRGGDIWGWSVSEQPAQSTP
ncbi:MAG: hypothetical protein FJ319_03110 [SAR202 cluster bacterium]|nr:hypothetical protein [SAR202 cluster bacterium]